jgi:pentalenic acid synthase
MTETTQTEISSAYPQQRTCPYQPPRDYARLQEQGPLIRVTLYDGQTAWMVTRNADARRLLADRRLSSDRSRDGFPIITPRLLEVRDFRTLVTMDGAEHQMYRRMLIPDFTFKRTRGMRPEVERITDECIDRLLAGDKPVDLMQAFAGPVSSMVIFHLLGVPPEDQRYFMERGAVLLRATSQEEADRAVDDLVVLLDRIVASRADDSGTWMLDRLNGEEVQKGELSRDDLVGMAVHLLVTGQGTTAQMIGLGVATLFDHPEQLAELRADPELIPDAVEELLRYLTIADLAGIRVAVEDIELHGQTIRAGEGVIMSYSMLDRDPDAYSEPDRFDIHRTDNQHFAFGYGAHNCIAQGLAKLELEVAYRTLFERIPTLRPAVPVSELRIRDAADLQGILELPVTW